MRTVAIGIDFGTTNSSVARAGMDGAVELARFPCSAGAVESYRSLLYLDQVKEHGVKRIKSWSGPLAVEEYLSADTKGRLIQSLKSFLTSRTLRGTEVFGRRMTLQDLIVRILRDLREQAEAQFGVPIDAAVVGYRSVEFELEPVAAAQHYESTHPPPRSARSGNR